MTALVIVLTFCLVIAALIYFSVSVISWTHPRIFEYYGNKRMKVLEIEALQQENIEVTPYEELKKEISVLSDVVSKQGRLLAIAIENPVPTASKKSKVKDKRNPEPADFAGVS